MSNFDDVLAKLLAELGQTELTSVDDIANMLSENAIYIEELREEERRAVDKFLQEAFALWTARNPL